MADRLMREIEARLDGLFQRLASGDDAPPAQVLRIEGLLEAADMLGSASRDELRGLVATCAERRMPASLRDAWGEDWQACFPFPQIPAFTVRAPVAAADRD
jgi:hypothetical protein